MARPVILEIPSFFSGDGGLKTEILSFNTGPDKPTGRRDRHSREEEGTLKTNEMTVIRHSDEASARFLSHHLHGKKFPQITISLHREDDRTGEMRPYFVFTMKEVLISGFNMSNSTLPPHETIGFDCEKIIARRNKARPNSCLCFPLTSNINILIPKSCVPMSSAPSTRPMGVCL